VPPWESGGGCAIFALSIQNIETKGKVKAPAEPIPKREGEAPAEPNPAVKTKAQQELRPPINLLCLDQRSLA